MLILFLLHLQLISWIVQRNPSIYSYWLNQLRLVLGSSCSAFLSVPALCWNQTQIFFGGLTADRFLIQTLEVQIWEGPRTNVPILNLHGVYERHRHFRLNIVSTVLVLVDHEQLVAMISRTLPRIALRKVCGEKIVRKCLGWRDSFTRLFSDHLANKRLNLRR